MPRHSSWPPAAARRPCRPCRRSQPTFPRVSRQNASAPPQQTSRTSPARSLVCRCKSSFPPSFARTSSSRRDRTRGIYPSCSSAQPNSNCIATRAAHIHVSETLPPVCPIAPAAFRRWPIRATISQSHESFPSSSLLFPSRHRPPTLLDSPQPPGPGYSSASAAPLPAATPCRKSPSLAPLETVPWTAPLPPKCPSSHSSDCPCRAGFLKPAARCPSVAHLSLRPFSLHEAPVVRPLYGR